MRKSILLILLGLGMLTVPTAALAQPVLEMRCAADSLDGTAALQRIEWARRCALTTNSGGPSSWFSSSRAFDTAFNWAKEYREINLNRAYSSSINDFNINYTYASCRYTSTPIVTVSLETSGPTTGYWKWSHTSQRPRPTYPIFETTVAAGNGTQLFPLPSLPGDCNLYLQDPNTGSLSRWTGNFYVVGYCVPN